MNKIINIKANLFCVRGELWFLGDEMGKCQFCCWCQWCV